jgi:hydroxyacylglutathione hydrolase
MGHGMVGGGAADAEDLEIAVPTFVRARQGEPLQVVDVREPEELTAGIVPGALTIPLGELPARLGELDPGRTTVVICRSGYRSLLAAEFLRDQGFARPRSLAGGMLAWTDAGHPVER